MNRLNFIGCNRLFNAGSQHCMQSQSGVELVHFTAIFEGKSQEILLAVNESEPAIDFTKGPGSH